MIYVFDSALKLNIKSSKNVKHENFLHFKNYGVQNFSTQNNSFQNAYILTKIWKDDEIKN